DRLHRNRNVAMTSYEDDGQPASELDELILQLRPAQAGHLHIQQNTAAIPARQHARMLYLKGVDDRRHDSAGASDSAQVTRIAPGKPPIKVGCDYAEP